MNTSLGGSYGGIGVALLLRLLNARADTDKYPPVEEEGKKIGAGGIKSASGLDACGDWIRTRFLVGDCDEALDLVGVASSVGS